MHVISQTIAMLGGFIGVLGSLYCLAEAFTVHRLMRSKGFRTASLVATDSGTKLLTLPARARTNDNSPAVSIFKPLGKWTPELRRDIETLFEQDYTGTVEIIFGLHDESDPARETVDQLKVQHSNIKVVVSPERRGTNAKVANLLNMVSHAKYSIFVICDGDIAVSKDLLSTLIGTLEAPGVGLVSSLYSGVPDKPLFWPIMSAMGMSYSFLPNVVLAAATGLEVPCLGATMAIRRTTLAEVGGFERVANALADDYELGKAVRAEGYSVALLMAAVRHNAGERRASEFFAHELRWARTIRMINPIGYVLSALTHNVVFAALGVIANPMAATMAILAFAIGARIVLQHAVDRAFNSWSGPAWLLPLRDLLTFLVFALAFISRKVRWGGRVFDTTSSPVFDFNPTATPFRSVASRKRWMAGGGSA